MISRALSNQTLFNMDSILNFRCLEVGDGALGLEAHFRPISGEEAEMGRQQRNAAGVTNRVSPISPIGEGQIGNFFLNNAPSGSVSGGADRRFIWLQKQLACRQALSTSVTQFAPSPTARGVEFYTPSLVGWCYPDRTGLRIANCGLALFGPELFSPARLQHDVSTTVQVQERL